MLNLRYLASLLLITTLAAQADDLKQLLPADAVSQIEEQIRQNDHKNFAVVDYARHSTEPRLFLFDRSEHKLLGSYRVSHGRGSDADHDGYAESFSDQESSLASSLGTFLSLRPYESKVAGHGLSLRLKGLSSGNRNAERRAIVIHGASYMEKPFIDQHRVAGRSQGCLALANADRDLIVQALANGALIFALDTRQTSYAYLHMTP